MSTEVTELPIERLSEVVGAGVLGAAAVAAGHGVNADVREALEQDLDPQRVRSKPGRGNLSYLATHDVIRTANRIFGFGRWGYEVVDLTLLGSTPKSGKDNAKGVYVGYRCTVRLTVAGCVPVSGVGYGDGVEYQEQSPITAHELAVKEAESDALKRAFRNFGDQFGLILYAKEDEQRRIAAEKQAEHAAEEMKATDDEIEALKETASRVGPDVREKTDKAISDHRAKNETERGLGAIVTKEFVKKMMVAIIEQGNAKATAAGEAARDEAGATASGLKVPDGVTTTPVTDGTAASEQAVADAFAA